MSAFAITVGIISASSILSLTSLRKYAANMPYSLLAFAPALSHSTHGGQTLPDQCDAVATGRRLESIQRRRAVDIGSGSVYDKARSETPMSVSRRESKMNTPIVDKVVEQLKGLPYVVR